MHLWKPKNRLAAEKIAKENAKYFDDTLKTFQQKLTQAKEVTDIGARYLALESVEKEIKTCIGALSGKIDNQIEKLPPPPDGVAPAATLTWAGTTGSSVTWGALHGGFATTAAAVI